MLFTFSFTFVHKRELYIHKHIVRYQPEQEYDPQFNVSTHGQRLVTVSEVQNGGVPLNQV